MNYYLMITKLLHRITSFDSDGRKLMGQVGPVFIDHVFMNTFSRNVSNDTRSLPLYNRLITVGIF